MATGDQATEALEKTIVMLPKAAAGRMPSWRSALPVKSPVGKISSSAYTAWLVINCLFLLAAPANGRSTSEDDIDLKNHLTERIDISDAKINETLQSQSGKDGTEIEDDPRKYYEYSTTDFATSWIDLDHLNESQDGVVKEHPMLSKSYRRAATISLSFPFPFYGHNIENITIATGGFLYTGQYVHSWLAATQYIAPLMANFDTSTDEEAKIRYADNGTLFVVEWGNVYLQNHVSGGEDGDMPDASAGPFTFQALLYDNGDIAFAYKSVPLVISKIEDAEHPVKVGLSDAYIVDRTLFFVTRKTIYEYHRLSLKKTDIMNGTAVYFKALPTCNRKKTCSSCIYDEDSKELECQWCEKISMCSDGIDRHRQAWMSSGCDESSFKQETHVSVCPAGEDHRKRQGLDRSPDIVNKPVEKLSHSDDATVHISIATVVIVLLILTSIFAWFGYAYFFPHTWSGQMLIKYRPTRWQWLRGEPRYTAAAIHM